MLISVKDNIWFVFILPPTGWTFTIWYNSQSTEVYTNFSHLYWSISYFYCYYRPLVFGLLSGSRISCLCGLIGSVLDHRSLTITWGRISAWPNLEGVSSFTSLHYLWRLLSPISLPCAQKWPLKHQSSSSSLSRSRRLFTV